MTPHSVRGALVVPSDEVPTETLEDDEDEDDTSSAAASFAAMAQMSENYRRGRELYGHIDVANLKDFDEDDGPEVEVTSPEGQWFVLKMTAKRAEEESRVMAAEYHERVRALKMTEENDGDEKPVIISGPAEEPSQSETGDDMRCCPCGPSPAAPVAAKSTRRGTLLTEMSREVEKSLRSAQDAAALPCEVWLPDGCELYTFTEPEYLEVEVVLDSGAGLHVANRRHFPGYKVTPNYLSEAGAGFVAANGDVLDNQGEFSLLLTTKDESGQEHEVSTKFHVADVTRALWSVGVICDAGLEAKFFARSAVVQKPDGTPVCHFVREKGLYVTKVKVKNPSYKGFGRQAS